MEALAELTISGHTVVMTEVRVAALKARLSHFLRLVRQGERVTVYDRDKPVAEIVPHEPGPHRLAFAAPAPGGPALHEIPMPPPLALGFDIVEFLREDRDAR